ncbi:hypothetical protein DPMN_130922 [Dreissena polymorpha]|uniref:Uncharacterized protein n=1 Tax=Dreissena polymorpha TaxID=45954 RepID=A0A9D4K1M5_DREPO|nr:hypothetical protein DPMN_130922 [Dreissena polymorpha]
MFQSRRCSYPQTAHSLLHVCFYYEHISSIGFWFGIVQKDTGTLLKLEVMEVAEVFGPAVQDCSSYGNKVPVRVFYYTSLLVTNLRDILRSDVTPVTFFLFPVVISSSMFLHFS